MEKKRKKINVKFIVLILSLIVFLSMSIFTFAYFTDNKNYTGTLNFGELKLKVSGDSVTENSKTLSFDTARKLNNDSTWTGKYMPGDTINIKLKVGLEDGSEPAYYLVQISDNKNVFENAYYYSQNGTDVFVNNGQKIYKQGTTTAITTPIIGKILSAGDSNAHSLTISAKISENFEEQGVIATVECKIYAIQIANLTEKDAFDLLDKEINPKIVTFLPGKKVYDEKNDILTTAFENQDLLTGIGFYYKKDTTNLTGYAKDDTLTANLDAKLANSDKGKIEVWKKSDTDIAYVSDYDIYAAENCSYLFYSCSSLTKLDLTNFNTTNVTTMESMFDGCESLTTLDVSDFNTENVTTMESMFYDCNLLTMLNISSFNTTNVTNMICMFNSCSSLTTLDLFNFDTLNVTNMAGMFEGCSSLTKLDLTNFDTTNVTDMNGMFSECTSLTTLNMSSFNTTNVTDMMYMFAGCSSLTSLNLSNFNTINVKAMEAMFDGCSSLTTLDLSNFNTSSLTFMMYMFNGCSSLTFLDLSSFNTRNEPAMGSMFSETFSKSPSTSTLIISENFVNYGGAQFTKATLNSTTSLDTSVTVKRGTTIVS